MEPLDVYREKSPFGIRTIELYDDRAIVKKGGLRFAVPFENMDPTPRPQPVSLRRTRFLGCVSAFSGLLGIVSWIGHPPLYSHVGFWLGGFFLACGAELLRQSFRPIETAAFFSTADRHLLSVVRQGPDAGRFQDFVDRISAQIALVRSARLSEPPETQEDGDGPK